MIKLSTIGAVLAFSAVLIKGALDLIKYNQRKEIEKRNDKYRKKHIS